jgi:hypothetical protein
MPLPAGFEPSIPTSERPQNHDLDGAATEDRREDVLQPYIIIQSVTDYTYVISEIIP